MLSTCRNMISWKAVLLLALVTVSAADKPSPLFKKEPTGKEATATSAEKTTATTANTKVQPKAEARQDQYGAPAIEQYGAPAIEQYGAPAAPAQETYGAPKAPAQDTYGSPSAPVQEAYGAPAAPAYSAPAAPSDVGTQGYYYYYYPVSTSPVQVPLLIEVFLRHRRRCQGTLTEGETLSTVDLLVPTSLVHLIFQ